MTMHNEAIERAARAMCCGPNHCEFRDGGRPYSECQAKYKVPKAKAAISAFLADVPVSEGMDAARRRYDNSIPRHCDNPTMEGRFKAMAAKLAEEIQ